MHNMHIIIHFMSIMHTNKNNYAYYYRHLCASYGHKNNHMFMHSSTPNTVHIIMQKAITVKILSTMGNKFVDKNGRI